MAASRPRVYDPHDMNPIVLEAGLLLLSAVSFWLLDRYVVACEKI